MLPVLGVPLAQIVIVEAGCEVITGIWLTVKLLLLSAALVPQLLPAVTLMV